MGAATAETRRLDGEKARRIIDAMRTSVGRRGAAASTFDQVAREAGVSRGLLHYYFGSKERLLVEVLRRDSEIRCGLLAETLAGADSIDAIVDVLVRSLEDVLEEDPGFFALLFEMFSASRRQADIGNEMAQLYREVRAQVADVLREKEDQGVTSLRADADAVAAALFALGDGLALQVLSEPERDHSHAFGAAIVMARALLGDQL